MPGDGMQLVALGGMGEVQPGDDLGALIAAAADAAAIGLTDADLQQQPSPWKEAIGRRPHQSSDHDEAVRASVECQPGLMVANLGLKRLENTERNVREVGRNQLHEPSLPA